MTTLFLSLADQRIFFPPPTWLVAGWIRDAQHTLFFADKGSLKTFTVLDIAYSVATGLPTVLGPTPTRSGVVLYLSYEGEVIGDIRAYRTKAWEIDRGLEMPHPNFHLLPGPRLARQNGADYLHELVQMLNGETCVLVVIDTVFQATLGIKLVESGSEYSEFVDMLTQKLGCAVISIHHPPKGNKTREQRVKGEKPTPFGAQDLTVNTASLVYMERTGPTTTTIEQLYTKDTAEHETIVDLKSEKIPLGADKDGNELSSLVLRRLSKPQAHFETHLRQIVSRQVVWGALAAFGHPVTTETLANVLTRPGPNQEGRGAEMRAALTQAKGKGGALELYCMDGYWRLPGAD